MNRKLLTAALLAGVVCLNGCTSMSEYREKLKAYDDSISYAMNVTRQFWEPEFRDTPVPKGVNVSNSMLGWDVGLSTAAWLAGPRGLPGSFGLDLGMSILKDLGKEKPLDMQPHLMAYVNAAEFPKREDAEVEAVSQARQAVIKALPTLDLTPNDLHAAKPMKVEVLWVQNAYGTIGFENEALGCPKIATLDPNSTEDILRRRCWAEISIRHADDSDSPATSVPKWLKDGGRMAWPIALKSSIVFHIPEAAKDKVDEDKLFAATSRNLPENYWIYLQPKYKKELKGKTPPILLDNKGAHFYVVEKKGDEKK